MVAERLPTKEDKVRHRQQEYKEVINKGLENEPGIASLMQVYNEYHKIIKTSNQYLQEMLPKFIFSTTNTSE